jgi:hypothetical protein
VNRDKFVRRLTEVEGELAALQRQAQPADDDQTCVELLGRTLDELDYDELDRVMQLLRAAPDYACPLLLRACLARPEDREHTKPPVPDGRHCHDENPEVPLEDPRWLSFDMPEWRA